MNDSMSHIWNSFFENIILCCIRPDVPVEIFIVSFRFQILQQKV